jgi:protein TonB
MFEQSLVESRISHSSTSERWPAFASIGVQCALAGLIVSLPLMHPEKLSIHIDTPKILMPLPPRPPVPLVHVERQQSVSTSPSVPAAAQAQTVQIGTLLPHPSTTLGDPPPIAPIGDGMGTPNGIPNLPGLGGRSGPQVSVALARSTVGPLHISTGVSQGLLLSPIRPIYPAIAKAAHVEGIVVVEAVISRTGTIESLRVVNGPPMLQRAAVEAIQAARYQPYRLNGEAVEIQTTFSIIFHMAG